MGDGGHSAIDLDTDKLVSSSCRKEFGRCFFRPWVNALHWQRSMIAGTRFTSQSIPWGNSIAVPGRFIASRQLWASTETMQGKGNCPLPLHPIPKTGPKSVNYVPGLDCQLCARLDIQNKQQAPKERKKLQSTPRWTDAVLQSRRAMTAITVETSAQCYEGSAKKDPQQSARRLLS